VKKPTRKPALVPLRARIPKKLALGLRAEARAREVSVSDLVRTLLARGLLA
jgi:hypothetical protein